MLNQPTIGSDIVCMVKRSTLGVVQIMVCGDKVIAQESPGEDLDWGVFVTHSAQVLADSKPWSKLIKISSSLCVQNSGSWLTIMLNTDTTGYLRPPTFQVYLFLSSP